MLSRPREGWVEGRIVDSLFTVVWDRCLWTILNTTFSLHHDISLLLFLDLVKERYNDILYCHLYIFLIIRRYWTIPILAKLLLDVSCIEFGARQRRHLIPSCFCICSWSMGCFTNKKCINLNFKMHNFLTDSKLPLSTSAVEQKVGYSVVVRPSDNALPPSSWNCTIELINKIKNPSVPRKMFCPCLRDGLHWKRLELYLLTSLR